MKQPKNYKNPSLTVDAIIEQDCKILLIRRKGNVFNDYLALPGGFVDYGETVEDAVVREVKEEVGVDIDIQAILGVYSRPDRDPRGHVISVVFVCSYSGTPLAGDDAAAIEWVDLDCYSSMNIAFDHAQILRDYILWKRDGKTHWSDNNQK